MWPPVFARSALYVCTHSKDTLPNPKLSDGGGKRTVVMSGRKERMNDGVYYVYTMIIPVCMVIIPEATTFPVNSKQ